MPIRIIQWYLETVHQLHLSVGAIVQAVHGVARQAETAVREVLEQVRASPVVQGDETGWRQDGSNGYVWTFSTPSERYFLRRGRDKGVVDEVLDSSFSGVLVSDFYAAYNHYPGLKQRCWAHLLRDIHDLKGLYPEDAGLAQWAEAVHQVYTEAKASVLPRAQPGHRTQLMLEEKLMVLAPGRLGPSWPSPGWSPAPAGQLPDPDQKPPWPGSNRPAAFPMPRCRG